MASVQEVASASSCVSEVEIRRLCVVKLSRPETCLRSQDTCRAHRYLATPTNRLNELHRLAHA